MGIRFSRFFFYLVFNLSLYSCLFLFRDLLPAKYSADSRVISSIVSGELVTGSASYQASAVFFSFVPAVFLSMVVFLLGLFFVLVFTAVVYRVTRDFLILPAFTFFLLFPVLLFCFIFPQKDTISATFVAVIVLFLVKDWRFKRVPEDIWFAVVVIGGAYLVYGGLFRGYWLLIYGCFFIMFFALRVSFSVLIFSLVVVLFFIFFVDAIGFFDISEVQRWRDVVNEKRLFFSEGNRTMFFNPLDPGEFSGFVFNYIYAFSLLLFPVVYGIDAPSLFLQVHNLICFLLVFFCFRLRKGGGLPVLYISHVMVLVLFEPDQGSYMRHVSVVSIYLIFALSSQKIGRIYEEK